jgi:release factor glutamine methyltransferase
MNIATALDQAAQKLEAAGVVDARPQAASLLAFAIKKDRTFLIAHSGDELDADALTRFESVVARRIAREPYQYIVGKQEFFGLDFEVTPDVLIPRPETEILVEAALKYLRSKDKPYFCEIGVGSGCISIALLHELPNATAVAGDISEAALAVARRNAARHNVADRLKLVMSDVFENIPEQRFDAVVSNPPYVPNDDFESLQTEVRDFEPFSSLSDGSDGLSVIGCIIKGSPSRLITGGYLFMEIGFNQSSTVEQKFDPKIWVSVKFLSDLQGIPRIIIAGMGE